MKKIEKTNVSKAQKYMKSNKEVAGDFLNAAAMLILPQLLRIMDDLCSYLADFFKP